MEIRSTKGDTVRIPEPKAGVATAVRRYREERAVILHPSDFHRLVELEGLIGELAALTPIATTTAGANAHVESDLPGEPILDPTVLDELFGE